MIESILFALVGGAMIGLAASALLFFIGRVAGISGIVGGLLRPTMGDVSWRAFFVAGLLAGGALLTILAPDALRGPTDRSLVAVSIAGLLVGFGTRMGSGCTSGHGVCGLTRLSARSLVATGSFMVAGIATATLMHLLRGGA